MRRLIAQFYVGVGKFSMLLAWLTKEWTIIWVIPVAVTASILLALGATACYHTFISKL